MEVIVPIIVQLAAGAVGGNAVGQLAKTVTLGPAGNSVAGAIGGWLGTWLAGLIPGLSGLVNGLPAGGSEVGLDMGALAGQGAAGLAGGVILTAIAGFIKNATVK